MPIRLGTFNVWGLPGGFADDVPARMGELARRLPSLDLDVLLIQEAWTQEVRDTLREAALAADFEVADGHGASGGLMIFSRLPIRSNAFEPYRFRGDPERLSRGEFIGGKGFQTVTLETSAGPFAVLNTHLHATYRRLHPQLNSAVRTAQLMQLIGALHSIPGSLAVGGDFNCAREDVEYSVFSGLTRTVELADGRAFPTLSRSNYYKRTRSSEDKRVDYLFLRPGSGANWRSTGADSLFTEPVQIGNRERSLSDHFGFRGSFVWHSTTVAATARQALDPKAFELAHMLLDVAREEADRRERVHSRMAGSWALAAVVAAGLRRHPALDRRRFLRSSAGALALFSLTPAVGYGTLARLDSDHKRDAFDDARDILAQLEAHPFDTA